MTTGTSNDVDEEDQAQGHQEGEVQEIHNEEVVQAQGGIQENPEMMEP